MGRELDCFADGRGRGRPPAFLFGMEAGRRRDDFTALLRSSD